MLKNVISAMDIKEPKLKIAIIGDSGIGKSTLAATIASDTNKVFFFDFDDRFSALQGKPNVFGKTYVDTNPLQPSAIAELESDINDLEYDHKTGKNPYQTYVLDSATYFRFAVERELMRAQASFSETIKVGSVRLLKIPRGWDVFTSNRTYLFDVLGRLSNLGNLIVTFHERNERDEIKESKTTEKTRIFTGMVVVDPPHLAPVLSTFNDTWRLAPEYNGSSKRVVQLGLTPDFVGKTSLKGLNENGIEEPNIQKLLAKHTAAMQKITNN